MRIAILGGAFDPPHIGHYMVATQVKELLKVDQVWLMPCFSYFPEFPTKFSRITSPDVRFKMALTFVDYGFVVSDFEFKHNPRSRTIDTLRLLKEKQPSDDFYWIIGSDTLPTFHLWNDWMELVNHHNLVVFPRDTDIKTLKSRVLESFSLKKKPENITIVEGDVMVSNIASTHVRRRVRSNQPISCLVNSKVEEYIRNLRLYKSYEKA